MADPICRWRNPFKENVIELLTLLPKEELTRDMAREIVNNTSHLKKFFTTPYQLACQLGLYYENNNRYFPKFTYSPSEGEVLNYLQNWIIHYSVPNPYTRKFNDIQPLSIHSELCKRLLDSRDPINWTNTTSDIFNTMVGNEDILRNSINTHSPILLIINGMIRLKEEKSYEELIDYIEVDTLRDRNDKEYFFDLFQLTISDESLINKQMNQPIIADSSNLTQTERQQLIASRIGQGIFRRNLIADCNHCPVTEVNDTNLLIASHIKPWRLSNNKERIDHRNGFLLTPTYDLLFDKGLISFTNNKELIVSNSLSEENRQRLNLIAGTVYNNLPLEGREDFLQFHRNHILKE